MDQFSDEELAYLIKAVERMAPLAHRAEATLQGGILDKLREERGYRLDFDGSSQEQQR